MKKTKLILTWFAILFTGLSLASEGIKTPNPIHTVIVIRHAERSSTDDLTQEGKLRALYLAKMFQDASVNKIYSTNYNRTQLTVTPLAKEKNIPITLYDSNQQLIEFINHDLNSNDPQTIMVVGHSNTLAEIIYDLGGPSLPEIAETEFDHLFMITKSLKNVGFVHLHYSVTQ